MGFRNVSKAIRIWLVESTLQVKQKICVHCTVSGTMLHMQLQQLININFYGACLTMHCSFLT